MVNEVVVVGVGRVVFVIVGGLMSINPSASRSPHLSPHLRDIVLIKVSLRLLNLNTVADCVEDNVYHVFVLFNLIHKLFSDLS